MTQAVNEIIYDYLTVPNSDVEKVVSSLLQKSPNELLVSKGFKIFALTC